MPEVRTEVMTELLDEEYQGYQIKDDGEAMWAVGRIRATTLETQSLLEHYEKQKRIAQDKLAQTVAFFNAKLEQYFDSVPKHKTATRETYALPNGTLIRKAGGMTYQRDDKAFCGYLKQSGLTSFIETKEEPRWGEYKKRTSISGDVLVDKETGEVVQGVTLVMGGPTFDVKLEGM